MSHYHWLTTFLLGAITACLTGCIASSEHADRRHLSQEFQASSGFTLRTNAAGADRQLPPHAELSDGISVEEAIAIALWNNAAFQENLSKLGLARADLAQAGLLSNPNFAVLFPWGPKQLEFAGTIPFEALWLRPRRVAVAKLDAQRIADGLLQNGLDLVRDVRVAFIDLELAVDRARLARDAVALRERIAAITTARQRAGDATRLDTGAADVEVLRARDDARRLDHAAAVARERLLYLLGLNDTSAGAEFAALPPVRVFIAPPVAALEQKALAARPDLRASELAVEAAAKRAALARAEIFTLNAVIDANGSGKSFEMGPGAQLLIPILNQNQAGRARAGADVERAAWNAIGTQQRIRLEVRQAHASYTEASEALQNWGAKVLPPLEELVRGSEKAYELGDLLPIVVHENAGQLLTARVREAELRADARRTLAELQRSAGVNIGHDK